MKKAINASKKDRIMIFLICSIAGITLMAISFFSFKSYINKSNTYIETTAYVCGYDLEDNFYNKDYSCDHDPDYEYDYYYYDKDKENGIAIIVEYKVGDKVYRATSNNYSSNPQSLGTPVLIKYNPDNPEDIIWESSKLSYILMGVGGILFFVCGIVMSFSKKTKRIIEG